MPDWIILTLNGLQRSAVVGLAAELRAGGFLTAFVAFSLGAVHALTPGHGVVGRDLKCCTVAKLDAVAGRTHHFLRQQRSAQQSLRIAACFLSNS